ncbi:hypothetical protein Tco_0404767, partial [Tanacetum coccineum]
YLMYEAKQRDLTSSSISRKRILVYPDSNEEDEDYCSRDDVDINSMTLDEYDLYMARQCLNKSDVQDTTYGFTTQFFDQSPYTPNPPLDKKDSSFKEILDDVFRIGAENLRSMEQDECPNGCDDEKVRDNHQEKGDLLNFPTFSVTNVFASVCEHVDENVNISIVKEK